MKEHFARKFAKPGAPPFPRTMAKILIIIGLSILVLGLIMYFFPGVMKWIGRLPGDFAYEGKSFSFYFPLMTSLLLSLFLSLLFWLLRK